MKRLPWPVPPRWYQVTFYTGLGILTAGAAGWLISVLGEGEVTVMVTGCAGFGGFLTLVSAIMSVYSEREAVEHVNTDPPRQVREPATNMVELPLILPAKVRIEDSSTVTGWRRQIELRFPDVGWKKMRMIATMLVVQGLQLTYGNFKPDVFTEDEFKTFREDLQREQWAYVCNRKGEVALTRVGYAVMAHIARGTPPPKIDYHIGDTQPVRTDGRQDD